MTDENGVILSCSSCKSLHHLTVTTVVSQGPSVQRTVDEAIRQDPPLDTEFLKACVATHPASLSLRAMDVFEDLVQLRCADCRRVYELSVATFETRQK